MNSILDTTVSCFRTIYDTDDPRDINLLSWLQSDKYKDEVLRIRTIEDKKERNLQKLQLPAITPSGTFSRKENDALLQHSGLMQIDIDGVEDPEDIKRKLSRVVNVAYAGLSVSGRGVWGLVPITRPGKHTDHYKALANDFAKMGIELDISCSPVSKGRQYSWDPDAYFNHTARPYNKVMMPPPPPKYDPPTEESDIRSKVETLIMRLGNTDITASYGSEWLPICFSLANTFGEGGRGYFHRISRNHHHYKASETDRMYEYALRRRYDKYTISTLFYVAKQYNITYV